MCGFIVTAGALGGQSHRMLGRLTRRGPDGIGFWTDGFLTFAHSRLEIVGRQDQPEIYSSIDGEEVIAFNGELYGERHDASFLQAVLHNKVDPRAWTGFWAYARYSPKTETIELGRDQFGVKPLYYYVNARTGVGEFPCFVAGSTIRSVVDQLPRRPSLNYAALSEWARYQLVFGNHTFFEGVYRVMPGEIVTYDVRSGKVSRRVYEDIWRRGMESADVAWFEEARELLAEAACASKTSDVAFATTCSGGLDSSVVTRLTNPEHAFHANFSDPECNETHYAFRAIEGTRTRLLVTNASEDFDLCAALADIVQDFDDPCVGSVILPLDDLLESVRRRRYKVLLLGTGGDELFGGYVRYEIMRGRCPQASYREAFERASAVADPVERYELLSGKGNIAAFRFYNDAKAREAFRAAYEEAGGPIEFDRRHFLPALLTIDDRMTGRWGIEGRPTLLYQPFARHVAKLSTDALLADGAKSVARKLFAPHLPADVVERRDKMGFSTPVGTFVREQAAEIRERLDGSRFRDLFDLRALDFAPSSKWDRQVFGAATLNAWLEEHAT